MRPGSLDQHGLGKELDLIKECDPLPIPTPHPLMPPELSKSQSEPNVKQTLHFPNQSPAPKPNAPSMWGETVEVWLIPPNEREPTRIFQGSYCCIFPFLYPPNITPSRLTALPLACVLTTLL